jgi:hypothetical protein
MDTDCDTAMWSSCRPARPRVRFARKVALAGLSFGLASIAVVACGSSSPASGLLGSRAQQDCTAVSDVLADGPDPDADPVGYAQAQILPLQRLKVSDSNLHAAINNLVAAYQQFVAVTGSTASRSAAAARVSAAEDAVNQICPGAAP